MRILNIFGTRPEAIKMAPVVRALRARGDAFETWVCVTAQHREMLDQVMRLFELRADFDLDLMTHNQSLAQITANVLTQLEPVLHQVEPDWILVQGDTTTVMAASLLAFYHRIPVGHVEAGLRTWDKSQPFPEEINRKVADAICDYHFAPTEWARQNLLREGASDATIRVTGNTVIDALQWAAMQAPPRQVNDLFEQLELGNSQPLILVTAHRRENFGAPLENICRALRQLAQRFPRACLVYPVHLNPNVQQPVRAALSQTPNIVLLDPLDYLPMVHLLKRAHLVLTDSGGLQEEAPAFGVPVLVLRETTERPEAVEAGTARLVGTSSERIVEAASQLLTDSVAHQKMARAVNPFGDGHAAERIVEALHAPVTQVPDLEYTLG